MGILSHGFHYWRTFDTSYTVEKIREKFSDALFHPWDRTWRERYQADPDTLDHQRKNPPAAGLISVLIPVYNTKPELLSALLDSLLAQTYPEWEACLCVTGDRRGTKDAAERYSGKDARFRCVFPGQNEGISGNTNAAFGISAGGWIVLCDHDDLLPPDALWHIADAAVRECPDVIYTDEDKIDEAGRRHSAPHLKPDFCPDNLRSGNYVCHLLAVRRSLYEAVGGERPAFDGSQDHDLTLRLSEKTDRILHLPVIGYHWRTVGASMSHQHLNRCLDASCRAVQEHMARIGYPGRVETEDGILRLRYDLQPLTLGVLALMPGSAGADARMESLRAMLPGNTPIRIVVPAAGEPRTEALNRAVETSREDLLLAVDASVSHLSPGFAAELAMYAQRTDVGMVTPQLTDPSGRVLFSGFAVGTDASLSCPDRGLPSRAPGPFLRNRQTRNVAAVSAACLMVRREAWVPLDPAMGDVCAIPDACLRMVDAGLHHVYVPHARAVCADRSLFLAGNAAGASLSRTFRERWAGWHDPCTGQSR